MLGCVHREWGGHVDELFVLFPSVQCITASFPHLTNPLSCFVLWAQRAAATGWAHEEARVAGPGIAPMGPTDNFASWVPGIFPGWRVKQDAGSIHASMNELNHGRKQQLLLSFA